jgi:hypothetical protein
MQLAPHTSYGKSETRRYLHIGEVGEYEVISRKIDGPGSVELCFALYWSELESATLDITVTFHGVEPSNREVVISPGSGFARVDVSSLLSDVVVAPVASLTTLSTPLRPSKAEVTLHCFHTHDSMMRARTHTHTHTHITSHRSTTHHITALHCIAQHIENMSKHSPHTLYMSQH